MSKLGDFVYDLFRAHSAKFVLAIFTLLLGVFPALGARIEPLKQPTADLFALYVNTLMPENMEIGAAKLPDGGAILTQKEVAESANAQLPSE